MSFCQTNVSLEIKTMIDININIVSRTIPATPRSKDYPQGYVANSGINNQKKTTEKESNEAVSRTLSQPQIDIIQFIKENRENVIAALMDENGVLSVRGSIRATGSIDANQTFE